MGNVNSNDLESDDPKLLLLLVRYWSSVIEATDNLGTISRRRGKIQRRTSAALDRRNGAIVLATPRKRNKIRRKSSLSTSEKETSKFIGSSKTSSNGEGFSENENLLSSIPKNLEVFDWKTKTFEEIEKMKETVQRKGFDWVEEHANESTKSETKRGFRKRKKKKMKEHDERAWTEMWTLRSEKSAVSERISEECEDPAKPGKIFWKTSKLTVQDPSLLPKSEADLTNQTNPNMLWRCSKGIQKFGEHNDPEDVFREFDHFPGKFFDDGKVNYEGSAKTCGDSNAKEIVGLNTLGRKARLSRWAFLRHERNESVKADRSKSRRITRKKSVKRNSSFRVPQRRYSRKVRNELFQRNRNAGLKRWGLFKRASKAKSERSEINESCNCSCCSCDGCQEDKSYGSESDLASLKSSEGEMAPNSEEDPRIAVHNRKQWASDPPEKESQRPPVYNPEDYALSLKKWGKKTNTGVQLPLYVSQSTDSVERISAELTKTVQQNKKSSPPSTKSSSSSKNGDEKPTKKEKETTLKPEKKDSKNKENINLGSKDGSNKDFRNPILTLAPQGGEMSLRQFSSVTELLGKLKVDLRLAFPSFVQEFVGDPVDGVTLLLELLRAVQLSQASQQQKCPPQVLRRALLDEHSCLVCLKHCLRCPDAGRRLASSPAGLFTLAVCIMSNVTKSRIIALELLTKACESPAKGHKPVSEALSTLRLRFGEPVRFRFLVGMLNSAGAVELLSAAMKFINAFVETAPGVQQKVYIQAELEQAGFDSRILRKTLPSNSETVKVELNRWDRNYFDVEVLQNKVSEAAALRDKVSLLEKRIQILQEEKGILQSLEQCLKERCSELEEEVSIKTTTTSLTKSTAHIKPFRNYQSRQPDYYEDKLNAEKGESTPAEDEGISSSEQELSQDEDYVKGTYRDDKIIANHVELGPSEPKKPPRAFPNDQNSKIVSDDKSVKVDKMKETNVDDGNEIVPGCAEDEEETTIDEVIEELRNIVNDAETEAYAKEEKKRTAPQPPAKPPKTYVRKSTAPDEEKNRTYTKSTYDRESFEEAEIVPSILLPQPPRRTRSLVHIFLPGREYDGHDNVKNEFFDEDTDSESSDSLLTATREKKTHKNCRYRSLDVSDSYNNSFSSANTRTLFIKQHERYEENELNIRYGYEERNIDEEEIKRSHLKENSQSRFLNDSAPDVNNYKPKLSEKFEKKLNEKNLQGKGTERPADKYDNRYEKSTSFQGIKSCISGDDRSPFVRRTQRFIPIPVKRSQTFHIATPDRPLKRPEMKPKPKMGVSGLDFTRNTDKLKNESKYQSVDYKKNAEKKSDSNNDRYLKKVIKEKQKSNEKNKNEKNRNPLLRRGSFDGLFFVTEASRKDSKKINKTDDGSSKSEGSDQKKLKSKSLEKMDDGLDSLVDIVISPEQSKKPKASKSDFFEIGKNIGPRTRRSLAESSLFAQPVINNLNKENPPKPPRPAQRTSLTRNNSSSAPLHLPVEITVAPVQPRQQLNLYNFGPKSARSEDGLLSSMPPTRYPPDGSSSPMDFSGSNSDEKNFKIEDSPIYATPVKQSKLQKFFGNPKFENSVGTDGAPNQKYFESNYACTNGDKKSLSPMPRNIQNIASSTTQMVKNFISNPQKIGGPIPYKSPEKEPQPQSKLNFFLGTYQSQPPKPNLSPKCSIDSSSPSSLNSFNNSFLVKRGHANAGLYSGGRDGSTDNGYKSSATTEQSSNGGRQSTVVLPTKVTDSLSGLY